MVSYHPLPCWRHLEISQTEKLLNKHSLIAHYCLGNLVVLKRQTPRHKVDSEIYILFLFLMNCGTTCKPKLENYKLCFLQSREFRQNKIAHMHFNFEACPVYSSIVRSYTWRIKISACMHYLSKITHKGKYVVISNNK